LCVVTIGGGSAVLGAPLALAVRGKNQNPAATLFDSVVLGLAVGGLLLIALGNGGPGLAIAGGVAWVALGVGLAWRRGWPSLRVLVARRPDRWSIALAATLVAAAAVRLRSSNEVAWLGDMGAYVNWANEFARIGELNSSWPPLLPALMAAPSRLFGPAFTASVMPLFGILVLGGLVRVAGLLGIARPIQIGLLAVAAASPHLLWFSTFPASEMLQAVLLLGLVAVTALGLAPGGSQRHPATPAAIGVATALLTAALTFNRGQALGLVVPVLLVTACLVAAPGVASPAALRWWTGGALVGIGAGHVYGVEAIPNYWITMQLQTMLPSSALELARNLGLLSGATAAVVLIALVGAVIAGLRIIEAVAARRAMVGSSELPEREGTPWRHRIVCVALAIAGAALIVLKGSGEVDAALGRIGWLLTVLAALPLLLPTIQSRRHGGPVLFLGGIAVTYLLVHVLRFEEEQLHTVYLYWDRYLTSEYLPAVLCLGAVGVAALADALAGRVVLRRVGAALAAVAAAALVVSWLPRLHVQTQQSAFSGMFGFLETIAHRTVPDAPVVWTADAPGNLPGLFPNSSWAFGAPLQRTFGREVIGIPSTNNFAPDPIVTREDVVTAAACSPGRTASVVEWRHDLAAPGVATRLAGEGLTWTDRGRVSATTWSLGQGPGEVFQPRQLVADVYEVSVAPDHACITAARLDG
jgi:hypothetical protein